MLINWNKYVIFKSDEEWDKAKKTLVENIQSLEDILDTFDQDIQTFTEFTHLKILVDKSIEEVYCYPRRFIDIDINDIHHKEMFNEALEIYNRIVAITNKFEALIKDKKEIIEEYLKDDTLKYYQRYYGLVFNRLDHINECEDEFFKVYQSIRDEYQDLIANKLEYHTVNINNEEVLIDEVNYPKYINDDEEMVRKSVSDAYIEAYKDKISEIFSLYMRKLKNDIAKANAKKYTSLKQMKLLENELPESLIDKTITSVNKEMVVLHDYVSLKKKLSGLSVYHSYDAGYKKFKSDLQEIDYEEAFKLVRDSLAFLGDEYLTCVDSLYNKGSIDLLPKKGKRTMSYTSITYAGIPYICLNYKGQIDDVKTIAHEIGHATHLLFSKKNNNFEYFEFSLFTTEVVAKVNERLFYRYFLEKETNIEDKLMVLSNYIGALGNSLFSQVMLTEFEDNIINRLSNDEEVTIDDVNKLYEELLIKYNGDDYQITDNDKYGWLRISYFILQEPYYLYQYSISTALANVIYSKIITEKDFISKYIKFLSVGNNLNIIDSLKLLGINLDDEKIFTDAIQVMQDLIWEFKDLREKA